MSILDQHIRARQLNEVLVGRHFTEMEVTHHFDTQLRIHFSDFGGHDPTGKTILQVRVDNELLTIAMEGGYYLSWAGPETLYHKTPATLPKAYGIKLSVDDGSFLTIHIPGMQGCLGLANQEEYSAGKMQQSMRPRLRLSALDEKSFTFEAFKDQVLAKNAIICNCFLPFGEIGYMPDVLYAARINPRTKNTKLSDEELRRLYESIKLVNREIIEQNGEVLEKDVYGCPGGYRRRMAGQLSHKPCPVCGEMIQKQVSVSGMAVYYCPNCQPIKE